MVIIFGNRYDGKLVRDLDAFSKIIPYIMKNRSDSQIFYKQEFDSEPLDAYIKEKREQGTRITYMDIVIAATMKMISNRPLLNRFVMNGKIYQRDIITTSLVMKSALRDDVTETSIKFKFLGNENLDEVSSIIKEEIVKNFKSSSNNESDKLAKNIMMMPRFLVKLFVNLVIFLDNHELLPGSIIEASPFHSTFFITNLKSIKLDFIYHHLYNFGTTGMFISMGKETKAAVADNDNNIIVKKVLPLGVVCDERFCDGLYYSNSLKLFINYMANPSLLENEIKKEKELKNYEKSHIKVAK